MLVGHIEELPALQQDRPVGADAYRLLRQRQRHAVAGEGARVLAIEISGELVKHDDLGKAAVGPVPPVEELAQGGAGVERAELGADRLVEGGVLGPPLLGAVAFEPE